jgi:uncharacterized protein YeeX (DUF496 family)
MANDEIIKVQDGTHSLDVSAFKELLDQIEGADEKKKLLWMEIYDNAITDRKNAYVLLENMLAMCKQNTTEHAVHGRNITAYLSAMSRANDQLIKLADMVRKAEEESEEIDAGEMLATISNNHSEGRRRF